METQQHNTDSATAPPDGHDTTTERERERERERRNFPNRSLYTGDNLEVMRGFNSETVDLIYLDPPFNSKRTYHAPIGSQAKDVSFNDIWSMDDIKEDWIEDLQIAYPQLWLAVEGGAVHSPAMKAYLAFMAIRLVEMKRLLKDTGSIYLHCDPTASHYLKQLMDVVFGSNRFENEVVWCYSSGGASKKRFARKHDILLFYSGSDSKTFNIQREPYATPNTDKRKDSKNFHPDGRMMADYWNISILSTTSKERTGYPTQKPLALLQRIIKASSNEGDLVLDPFCGCATTCVAAEIEGRQWVGIDIEPEARNLVKERLGDAARDGVLLKLAHEKYPKVVHSTKPPKRTDPEAPRRSRHIKQKLFQAQDGRCAGRCLDGQIGRELEIDLFEVDHITPRSKGGADIDDNLQLLCATCNRIKGDRAMDYLLDRNLLAHSPPQ